MEYSAESRRAKILEILNENGTVKVSALSRLFGISEVTVRFDLEYLESQGMLSRVHGGAVSSANLFFDMNLKERLDTNSDAKKAIAEKIAEMVSDNDSLMMNSGTTLTYVLRAIRNKKNISIVTNSILIANEATKYPGIQPILLGGSVNSKCQYTYGHDAIAQLERYHANKLILSVDGICRDIGFTLYLSEETEVSRRMIEQAGKVIVAADHSKAGRVAFANIAPITSADHIVTDKKTPADFLDEIRAMGINVISV